MVPGNDTDRVDKIRDSRACGPCYLSGNRLSIVRVATPTPTSVTVVQSSINRGKVTPFLKTGAERDVIAR